MPSQGSSVASAKPTKRKTPAPPKTRVKKGKKEDPAKTVEVFTTEYGKMMFGDKGRFHLTPAESAHAGLLIQAQTWFMDKASSLGPCGTFVFTQAFVDGCQKDEQEIKDGGDTVDTASLLVFVKLIDTVGKFCNFDKELDLPWKLGNVLGSKCNALTKVDQAAEHFMLHMRNHFLKVASDQRKDGGSKLSLMVALLKRMQRDHKQAKTKVAFAQWYKDKELMQQGLANHSLALDTDSKSVCNEAIEELLLASDVTTVDIWSCTTHWSIACNFETVRGHKSPLSYYIEQARVAAAFRCTLRQPDIQRQISNASSEPDSVFSSGSSATDPVFGASSDDGHGAPWGTPVRRQHSQLAWRRRRKLRYRRLRGRVGQPLSGQAATASTARRLIK